ncbi:MAG: MBL fold metallo-hydrolase, partial [Proteobacteria bacterium]|nr:MBL fold metallo-hydrolase [Pseudomonadota bacterium]
NSHIVVAGFQARGTPGRALVDGTKYIRLWGETIKVQATIHTVGGLSAHADQADLVRWFTRIENHPQLILVHGESDAINTLREQIRLASNRTEVTIAKQGKTLNFDNL